MTLVRKDTRAVDSLRGPRRTPCHRVRLRYPGRERALSSRDGQDLSALPDRLDAIRAAERAFDRIGARPGYAAIAAAMGGCSDVHGRPPDALPTCGAAALGVTRRAGTRRRPVSSHDPHTTRWTRRRAPAHPRAVRSAGLLVLALLAPLVMGCDTVRGLFPSEAERAGGALRDALVPLARASDEALRAIALPAGVASDPARSDARVLVAMDAIAIDALPPVQARFAAVGDAYAVGRDLASLVPPPIARVATLHGGRFAPEDADGLILHPLAGALGRLSAPAPAPPSAVLPEDGDEARRRVTFAIARRVPYGTVAGVVYTAGQAGVDGVSFLVEGGGIDLYLPGPDGAAAAAQPVVELAAAASEGALAALLAGEATGEHDTARDGVTVPVPAPPPAPPTVQPMPTGTSGPPIFVGIDVEGRGVRVVVESRSALPGCTETTDSSSVTAPRGGDSLDLVAVGACLDVLWTSLGDRALVTVRGESTTPFEEIASVLAAVRGHPGAPRFPRVALAAPIDG